MRMRTSVALAAIVAAGVVPLTLTTPASAAPAKYADDVNGDGYHDLVTAAPMATVGGAAYAGAMVVIYGSASGISASRRTVITQNTTGIPGTAEKDDEFGSALASGDLNNDGYADLVIGAGQEDVGSDADGGTAVIVRGSGTGLSGGQTVPDPAPSAHDRYGMSLAVGDFSRDGRADLAVGSTGQDIWIHRGGFTKASGAQSRFVLNTDLETGNTYGAQGLAPGDVNGDGSDDLVISGTYRPDGATYIDGNLVYTGSPDATPLTLYTVLGSGGRRTAAVGDLNGDGYDDVVTSAAPGSVSAKDGGSVRAYLGGEFALPATPQATITQDSPGVPGSDEPEDWFGHPLSVGDVNGDGYADVAVGAIYESVGSAGHTGTVTLLRGSSAGLTGTGAQSFSRTRPTSPAPPRTTTTSAPPSASPTSTATARRTCPSAPMGRTARTAPCGACAARRPASPRRTRSASARRPRACPVPGTRGSASEGSASTP